MAEHPTKENRLCRALQFCLDMAEEEYPHQQGNVGAELVLRHIMRKCRETLSAHHGETP